MDTLDLDIYMKVSSAQTGVDSRTSRPGSYSPPPLSPTPSREVHMSSDTPDVLNMRVKSSQRKSSRRKIKKEEKKTAASGLDFETAGGALTSFFCVQPANKQHRYPLPYARPASFSLPAAPDLDSTRSSAPDPVGLIPEDLALARDTPHAASAQGSASRRIISHPTPPVAPLSLEHGNDSSTVSPCSGHPVSRIDAGSSALLARHAPPSLHARANTLVHVCPPPEACAPFAIHLQVCVQVGRPTAQQSSTTRFGQ